MTGGDYDHEFGNGVAKFTQPFDGPGKNPAGELAPWNVVFVLQQIAHMLAIVQPKWRLIQRADLILGLADVIRLLFHQHLEMIREGRFAAAAGAKQVKDLLAFLEALGSVPEEADDPFDRLFHAIEVFEGGVPLDRAVQKHAP